MHIGHIAHEMCKLGYINGNIEIESLLLMRDCTLDVFALKPFKMLFCLTHVPFALLELFFY